ncbi:hypothetical protein HPG69_014829 [Diceros bicornis minor]|uniref:Uncharacterized protein n=1 Tax=Diceros bicornis minor TaxID=77932 RepID=A0A7J7EUT9_DICBM|nr:hypothetical protein HPG69_014829 [Diceros bicornis minor]
MEIVCDYGNSIRTVARVPGPAFGHQIAYCNLLPRDRFPPFPPHQDHVTVEMSVRVNGRNIVGANFTIYDCSRVGQVYPHTARRPLSARRANTGWFLTLPSIFSAVLGGRAYNWGLLGAHVLPLPQVKSWAERPLPRSPRGHWGPGAGEAWLSAGGEDELASGSARSRVLLPMLGPQAPQAASVLAGARPPRGYGTAGRHHHTGVGRDR